MKRRQLLKAGMAGLAGLACGATVSQAQTPLTVSEPEESDLTVDYYHYPSRPAMHLKVTKAEREIIRQADKIIDREYERCTKEYFDRLQRHYRTDLAAIRRLEETKAAIRRLGANSR